MSDSGKRKNMTKELLEEEHVDVEEKQNALQSAIFDIGQNDTFMGSVLQCLEIYYSHIVPRAGVMFNPEGKKWQMIINPYWFVKKNEFKARKATLMHEISHITHKHPMRAPFIKLNPNRRALMNIAMDMSINQNIPHLPNGCKQCPPTEEMMKGTECENKMCPGKCIDVNEYFDIDDKGNKVHWPKNKPMEFYYHKLIERFVDSEDPNGEGGEGEGSAPNEFDTHDWESASEESDMLDATEELVKRAMQKRGLSYSNLPKYAQELLDEIDARRSELDIRKIIHSAIKRNASGFNREKTWTRRSRRYGYKSAGTRNGQLPKLGMYMDSSGSISVQEANDNLATIDDFLKVGSRECMINLWHTSVYYSEKYKINDRLDREVFQNGGTDIGPTLAHIAKTQPDLAIIYTDGCYSDVDYMSLVPPNTPFPQCLFIISRDGYKDHPLKRLGETIQIPSTDFISGDKTLEQ